MFEKTNSFHPDKIADRVAGAIVDLCYQINDNPKVAVEVLIGHGNCHIIMETSVAGDIRLINRVQDIIHRIVGQNIVADIQIVKQDPILASNQEEEIRCGDNGIFLGMPVSEEQLKLITLVKKITSVYPYDGKYLINNDKVTMCQSNALEEDLRKFYDNAIINPLGFWTGGIDADSGATNRKLGSDMGDSVTGGGLHGKDISKADVSVNIVCWLKAQELNTRVEAICNIGDREVTLNYNDTEEVISYKNITEIAKDYINKVGGFEKFAEWGLLNINTDGTLKI